MAKKIFNFGERLALYEDLPTNTQYNTMPEPNIENINNIIQYTGDTNQNYTNGYYYKCISDGQDPATYSWEQINVQPAPSMSEYEQISNKVTSLSNQNTDTQYPSAKAVFDMVQNAVPNISSLPVSGSGLSDGIDLTTATPGIYIPNKKTQYFRIGSTFMEANVFLVAVVNKYEPNPSTLREIAYILYVDRSASASPNYNFILRKYYTPAGGTGFTYEDIAQDYGFISKWAQTFQGVKTFVDLPVSTPVPIQDGQLTNKKYVDDQDKIILNNIAPQYSTSSTYNEGDHVIYNGVLYECNTTISVAEAWTPAHWTQKEILSYIDNKISNIDITKREIVQTLPTQDIATDTIYMVPSSTPGTQNVYNEYMYINNAWELIGNTAVDLNNYYTKTEVDSMIQALATQIGNITEVLSHLVDTVEPINTTLYTKNITVDGNSGTYEVIAKEHHIDTDYYVLDYNFTNTSSNTIRGLILDEIYDDGVNPAKHVPLLWPYDIEPGETVALTSYWQDPTTYQASLAKYNDTQNITVESGEASDALTFTQDLPLANLGFTTDVVAHTTAYNSNDVTGGFTRTEFDRTGGSEDPYDVPESFRVAWINQNNQTFGTLSEPIDGSLTMTRSYYGFDEAHFDATNTKFFLIKTADIVDCTYQEFLDAYNAFINGGV